MVVVYRAERKKILRSQIAIAGDMIAFLEFLASEKRSIAEFNSEIFKV